MNAKNRTPDFVWDLVADLQRRGFPLGVDDVRALRDALHAGFGLGSRSALRDLCIALWAKSLDDAETIRSLLDVHQPPDWDADIVRPDDIGLSSPATSDATAPTQSPVRPQAVAEPTPATTTSPSLPPLSSAGVPSMGRRFILHPMYPLTHREIGQAWRRLRRPLRSGPPVELDVDATVQRRSRMGVATPPVVVPRRRNVARLVLLVDRQGSMAPYHPFIEHVTSSILDAGWLERVDIYYFHDVVAQGADQRVLPRDDLFPRLDGILTAIRPLTDGYIYEDPERTKPVAVLDVLANISSFDHTVLISDVGAARGRYDPVRLLDTLAFLKALRHRTPRHVYLNPVPMSEWAGSTAEQLARHSPMFPLDREGMHRAVNVLRGQPVRLERPV